MIRKGVSAWRSTTGRRLTLVVKRRKMHVCALVPQRIWAKQLRPRFTCDAAPLRLMSSDTVTRLTGALEQSIQETEPVPAPIPPAGWTSEQEQGSKALTFRCKATTVYMFLDDIEYKDEVDEEPPTAFSGLKNMIGASENSEPTLDAIEKFHFATVIEAANSSHAMMFDCTWARGEHDGEEMVINHAVPFDDAARAHTVAMEANSDQNLYEGPALHQIDEEISDLFHIFLEEHGFDEPLFSFMMQQASHKEFLEDERWMQRAVAFMRNVSKS